MRMKEVLPKLIYLSIAFSFLSFLAVFGLAQGVPLPTQPSEPRHGGTLRIADLQDASYLGYPPKIVRVYANRQAAPAIETLFRTDETGKLVPWLATGFTNNVATKSIILSLRKGVKFHDGTDFDAEAVKWNLDQCKSANTPGTEMFRSIDVVDGYSVRINLIEWDGTVISNLAMTIGMMISPTTYKKNGEAWCANHPVGTGPFQFVNWEKDVRITYKKFDGYWQKGKPYLDGIIWTPIIDSVTRLLSFRAGELDVMITNMPKDIADLEKAGCNINRNKTGFCTIGLIPDSASPQSPFANVKVRQASAHAIDTKSIIQSLLYGEADAPNQFGYNGHWGYNPSVVGYPYNPAKAKQLLAEAGYPNGFKTKLLYLSNTQNDQKFTAVQGYLKAVGIDAELDPVLVGRYEQVFHGGSKWEGLAHGPQSNSPDAAAALREIYGGRKFVWMVFPDDYMKALHNAITAPDFGTKQKYVHEAEKLLIDRYCLMIPIDSPNQFGVGKPYVHDHGLYGVPSALQWTPEDVWTEK